MDNLEQQSADNSQQPEIPNQVNLETIPNAGEHRYTSAQAIPDAGERRYTSAQAIPDAGERRYTGVGTLIITTMNNKPCLVLGREAFKSIKHRGAYMVSIFEEFGGGIQRRRATLADNACFELREETSNLLDLTECSQILEDRGQHFDLPFRDDRIYRLYVINIPEAHTIIPYLQGNRQIITRALNNPAKGTKSKIKTYLEMDTIKLVSLDAIQRAMMDINNYVCFKAEDTVWNLSAPAAPYRGILKVDSETFLNERLVQFLGGVFTDEQKKGYDICRWILTSGQNKLELTKPVKIQDNYYKFLVGTFTFAPVGYLPRTEPEQEQPETMINEPE
jgi:hypothetical protein